MMDLLNKINLYIGAFVVIVCVPIVFLIECNREGSSLIGFEDEIPRMIISSQADHGYYSVNDSQVFFSIRYYLDLNSTPEKYQRELLDIYRKNYIQLFGEKSDSLDLSLISLPDVPKPYSLWKNKNSDTMHVLYKDSIHLNFIYRE